MPIENSRDTDVARTAVMGELQTAMLHITRANSLMKMGERFAVGGDLQQQLNDLVGFLGDLIKEIGKIPRGKTFDKDEDV